MMTSEDGRCDERMYTAQRGYLQYIHPKESTLALVLSIIWGDKLSPRGGSTTAAL